MDPNQIFLFDLFIYFANVVMEHIKKKLQNGNFEKIQISYQN